MTGLHTLKRMTMRSKKRVGRGQSSGRGKTSGRGTKGQNARAGRKKRPEMRDIIKRLPKLRGRGKNSLKTRLLDAVVVKLSVIEEKFKVGEKINPQILIEKGIIKTKNGKTPIVKILADKEIKKSF